MTTMYVREQGAVVGRRGERLEVRKDGVVTDSYPLQQIEGVVLMGNVQMTAQAENTLVDQGIEIVRLSSHGRYRSTVVSLGSKRVTMRQRQLRLAEDPVFGLSLAQAFVDGKIHNQRVLLQRQRARLVEADRRQIFDQALDGMLRMRQAALQAQNVESVRGHEGQAAVHYFAAVRSLLDPAWRFERRAYHPPPDPFNALLSFLYSLLLKDVLAAVHISGLDPNVGFFHEPAYGRPSLALDLMEEWRPLVADALALEFVNRGSITVNDFRETSQVGRPIEMREQALRRVLEAYGQRLEVSMYHPQAGGGGGQTPLRRVIQLQSRQLARVVSGEQAGYTPVKGK